VKRLSEVCKLVGVTRRTLQEYDKIDLVKPSGKNELGHWLYDDDAIQQLNLIQVFIEAGYERKAIKSILDAPVPDMIHEFDRLIEDLEARRKRLDGMIRIVRNIKESLKLPESTLFAMENLNLAQLYANKSFSAYFDESISLLADCTQEETEEFELYTSFVYSIFAIGCLMRMPENCDQVQAVVEQAYKDMLRIAKSDEEFDDEALSETELADAFREEFLELLNEPEIIRMLELQCGSGALDYIIRAVQEFAGRKKQPDRE